MPDNFSIDITADRGLLEILKVVFDCGINSVTRAWVIDPSLGFILFWHSPNSPSSDWQASDFPIGLYAEGIHEMLVSWLKAQEYGREPDIDGSCVKGFRIYNSIPWDPKRRSDYVICAIQPAWTEYHK